MSDHLARLGYPGPHPPAWWCPTCGELEGAKVCCHTARHAGTPSGPPPSGRGRQDYPGEYDAQYVPGEGTPVPAGRQWAAVRRRRDALAALARIGGAS